jgi:hypothetical protein
MQKVDRCDMNEYFSFADLFAIVEHGSFSLAAIKLDISQSAVSRAIWL